MSQTPPRPAATPAATAKDKPAAARSDEKPAAARPDEKPAAARSDEKPAAAKPDEKPVAAKPDEKPVAAKPDEKPDEKPAAAPAPAPTPAAPPAPAPAASYLDSLDLDRLPAIAEIEPGDPEAPARPPGHVPPGSRSMRRRGAPERFALIYLDGSALITRQGVVGRQGTWRVVEYPTVPAAARAYADICSELGAEGFDDYVS